MPWQVIRQGCLHEVFKPIVLAATCWIVNAGRCNRFPVEADSNACASDTALLIQVVLTVKHRLLKCAPQAAYRAKMQQQQKRPHSTIHGLLVLPTDESFALLGAGPGLLSASSQPANPPTTAHREAGQPQPAHQQ